MARRKNYYHSYRGRSAVSRILKGIIVILLILLALLTAAFFLLGGRVVRADGGIRIQMPVLTIGQTRPSPTPAPSPEESLPVVVETPEPTAEPQAEHLRAVEITVEQLLSGTAAEQMEAAGGNALLLTMKDSQGLLAYVSGLELAVQAKASGGDLAVNQALEALAEEGVYLVARVECFRDHLLPEYDRTLAITTNSGYRRSDAQGTRWVSPLNDTVTDYLAGIVSELAELGFDEVVLTSAAWPVEGQLGYIRQGADYPVGELDQAVTAFYAKMAAAAEAAGLRLSVETEVGVVMNGSNGDSGQTLDGLARYADRVWMRDGSAPASQLAEALEQAGLEQEPVLWTETARETGSWALSAA